MPMIAPNTTPSTTYQASAAKNSVRARSVIVGRAVRLHDVAGQPNHQPPDHGGRRCPTTSAATANMDADHGRGAAPRSGVGDSVPRSAKWDEVLVTPRQQGEETGSISVESGRVRYTHDGPSSAFRSAISGGEGITRSVSSSFHTVVRLLEVVSRTRTSVAPG